MILFDAPVNELLTNFTFGLFQYVEIKRMFVYRSYILWFYYSLYNFLNKIFFIIVLSVKHQVLSPTLFHFPFKQELCQEGEHFNQLFRNHLLQNNNPKWIINKVHYSIFCAIASLKLPLGKPYFIVLKRAEECVSACLSFFKSLWQECA